MPFHSTETEEDARGLIVLYCKLSYDGRYKIRADWPSQDILAAMSSACRQFGLEPQDNGR